MQNDLVRLTVPDGIDLISEIKKFVSEQPSSFYEIVSMRGKLRDFELLQSGKQQNRFMKHFHEPHKIINVSGTIKKNTEDVDIKLVMSMTKDGFSSIGGKLVNGKSFGDTTCVMKKVDEKRFVSSW